MDLVGGRLIEHDGDSWIEFGRRVPIRDVPPVSSTEDALDQYLKTYKDGGNLTQGRLRGTYSDPRSLRGIIQHDSCLVMPMCG